MPIEFIGKLNGIVFENEKDLFKILDVDLISDIKEYSEDNIRVTGNFGDLQVGSNYKFMGELVNHPKFGQQFKANSYQQAVPHEENSVTNFLSSNSFPGIGKKSAEKIVNILGADAITLLKNNPNQISELSLTAKQKDSLLTGLNKMDSFSEVTLKLARFGINKNVAANIYRTYHGEAIKKIKNDPYGLIADIRGYSFKSADKIGAELNIGSNDIRRIKGAVFQVLDDALVQVGNTFVELSDLLTTTNEILNINNFDLIASAVNELQQAGKVVVQKERAALQSIFETENNIALELKRIDQRDNQNTSYSKNKVSKIISKVEKKLKIKYDDTQKIAINNAINNSVSILTGGPGTGKTTIINGILMCLQELEEIPSAALYSTDSPFLLAAPTGRAAKRMSEITEIEAKTIHRLLGLGIGNTNDDDLNELNGEVLIIDEMSMVDMFLFRLLLKSINSTKHIIFVGDKDQLPSVGAGNVFSDLIDSQAFPTIKLETIHRQGDGSSIITLAHAINSGKGAEVIFKKTKNYSFIPCQTNLIGDAITQIINIALKRGFKKDDIQVLGAMYHGAGGITHLNNELQKILNPKKSTSKKIEIHNEFFQIGDRVLQLQNNFEKDIYNGQIGKIIGINEEKDDETLTVNFDGKEVKLSRKDLFDLTRAYAITIHKSQGSEFPLVILNLNMQNFIMLRRNLLYTAITRAEKNLVMVGDKSAYLKALEVAKDNRRTDLKNKIVLQLNIKTDSEKINGQEKSETDIKNDFILTPEIIYSEQIDPMIGMNDIQLHHKNNS